jgi:hypothetical protein
MPKLGAWQAELDRLLEENAGRASRERLTLMRLFEALRGLERDRHRRNRIGDSGAM